MVVIMQITQEKADLQKTSTWTTQKVGFVWMDINFILGKNRGHRPSSLGSRSIVVVNKWVSKWDEILAAFKFHNFDSKVHKLFEWIYDANSIVRIDFMAVFWRKMLS